MYRKHLLQLLLCVLVVLTFSFLAGCGSLRFAPSESQKQLAFSTHQTAAAAADLGLQPGSVAAGKLVDGTAAALAYTGMPKSPQIEDYSTTASQAAEDAARRPTADDVFTAAEGGLSLAAELAILFGAGGVGIGGKKLLDWIALARKKSAALKEVVQGNDLLANYLRNNGKTAELDAFKASQNTKQSDQTKLLVAAERIGSLRYVVADRPVMPPAPPPDAPDALLKSRNAETSAPDTT